MIQELTVVCVECGAEVPLTESLAAPLLEASKAEFDRKLAEKNKELREQALEMERRQSTLAAAEAAMDATIRERVNAASKSLTDAAEKKAKALVADQVAAQATALKDTELLLKSRTDALKEAKEATSALRKDKADLEERSSG